MVKFFNHSELELVVSFMAPTPAPQQMQIKAPAPRKMLGSRASSSSSPALPKTYNNNNRLLHNVSQAKLLLHASDKPWNLIVFAWKWTSYEHLFQNILIIWTKSMLNWFCVQSKRSVYLSILFCFQSVYIFYLYVLIISFVLSSPFNICIFSISFLIVINK